MRRSNHLQPFVGGELVGADQRADPVVEDLGRRARQRAQALVLQAAEVVGDGRAEGRGALAHLQRREGVDVHAGPGGLHGAQDRDIGLAGVLRMNAALQADLGGALRPGLLDAPGDLGQRQVVGPVARAGLGGGLGEGAEAAAVGADVGVVDVAVDHVGHGLAASAPAQLVGGGDHRFSRCAAGCEQPDDVALRERGAARRAGQDRVQAVMRRQRRRCAQRPLDRPRRGVGDAGAPGAVARQALGIRQPPHRLGHARVHPAPGVLHIGRIDGEPLDERPAGRGALGGQGFDLGPRSLGVHVVDGHRRYAAPVVEAGGDQRGGAVGVEVRRGLDADRRVEHQAGGGDGPQQLLLGGLGPSGHRRARLGPEVLDDDLLQVAVAVVQVAEREEGVEPLLAGFPDPDQQAAGERHGRRARRGNGGQAHRRLLVRRAEMRSAACT